MAVRAKFKVTTVTPNGEDGGTVWLNPVVNGSEENESFYRYTPGGNIVLSTINQKALEQFEVGDEFYVDFTKA